MLVKKEVQMKLSNKKFNVETVNDLIDESVKFMIKNHIFDPHLMLKISRDESSPFSQICKMYYGYTDYTIILRLRTMWKRNQKGFILLIILMINFN